jgi:hypothetical protein
MRNCGSSVRTQRARSGARAGSRRGVTLLETVVVIGVGTVIVGVATGLVCTLMQVEKNSRQRRGEFLRQARLADQFRRDVRAAIELSQPAEEPGPGQPVAWEFRLPAERRVQYRVQDSGIERQELAGEQIVRRETYRLPRGADAAIQLAGDEGTAVASLRITRSGPRHKTNLTQVLRVDALLAADHRFAEKPDAVTEEPGPKSEEQTPPAEAASEESQDIEEKEPE